MSRSLLIATTILAPTICQAAEYELKLLDWRCYRSGDRHVLVEGRVQNLTAAPIKRTVAVVQFLTAHGSLVTSDSAHATFDPVMPKQISPFKVIAFWQPEMRACRIEFQRSSGPTIATENVGDVTIAAHVHRF
jgi:hypothetical protein